MNPEHSLYAPPAAPAAQILKCRQVDAKIAGTYSLDTSNALLNTSSGILEFTLVPEWCLPAAGIVCAVLSLVFSAGALLVYFVLHSSLIMFCSRPATLRLAQETVVIDRARGLFGLRKKRGEKHCFIAFRADPQILDYLARQQLRTREQKIAPSSKTLWHVLVIAVIFAISYAMIMLRSSG